MPAVTESKIVTPDVHGAVGGTGVDVALPRRGQGAEVGAYERLQHRVAPIPADSRTGGSSRGPHPEAHASNMRITHDSGPSLLPVNSG